MKQLRRGYMRKVDREAYLNSMREIDIHKQIRHPGVVQLREVIDDSEDDKVYLIMEAAEGGQTMYQEEGRWFIPGRSYPYSEVELRHYARQLLEAVAYLHASKILHCDIKP